MRMSYVRVVRRGDARRGGAAVELAGLLPIMIFSTMAATDFARIAYVQVALQNCARNGAIYAFYTKAGVPVPSGWANMDAAVRADTAGMNVTYTVTTLGSGSNNTITVTVSTTYTLIALGASRGLTSIPSSLSLSQSAKMPYPASATYP